MMTNSWLFICIFIFLIVALSFIPYLTRKTESFGVSIPQSLHHRDDFKAMRKKYMLVVMVLGIIMLSVAFISSIFISEKAQIILFLILLVLFGCLSFIIYLPFHFRMKQIKNEAKWFQNNQTSTFIDTNFHLEKRTLSAWLYFIPLCIILITIVWTVQLYEYIPSKLPMHTDFAGNTTYEIKTWTNVFLMPGTQVFLLIVMFLTNFVIKSSKQQINSENPTESKQRNLLFRRKWSVFLLGTTIILELLFSFIQFSFIYPALDAYINSLLVVSIVTILLWTVVLSVRIGQGGERIKLNQNPDQAVLDTDKDCYWKLGMFYVNKNDPAVFIEKRFGIGWTCNWARPFAWIFIIGIIAVPIGVAIAFI